MLAYTDYVVVAIMYYLYETVVIHASDFMRLYLVTVAL